MNDRADSDGKGTGNARLWWIAAGLSLGPAVVNGLARFSYGLLLPAMRTDLGWNYTQAGWINTANAIGYLVGALLALSLISRLGPVRLFNWGMVLTGAALVFSAVSRDFWALSFWRLLAGIGGAPVFIAGGALASAIFSGDRARNALVIALYYGGGGLGMLLTALVLPWYMATAGNAGWPVAWLLLGAASLAALPLSWRAANLTPALDGGPALNLRNGFRVKAMLPALFAYFLFGVGYVIYITFLIAWMRGEGAGPFLIAVTWGVMGAAVMLSPFVWRRVLARAEGGLALSLTSLATGSGVLLPLLLPGTLSVILSAALFGLAFFMVPTSATTFVRKNLPSARWGGAIALFTVVFSVGQIAGPVGAGALTDLSGGAGPGLIAAGLILLLGAFLAILQKPLAER